jgi:diguanylate cyclase (GGDEF)-like protein
MKKWMEKLIQQFDFDWSSEGNIEDRAKIAGMNEDRATLLFIIDTFNKHLIEVEGHPVRKTRETLDEFAKEIISPVEKENGVEKVLFRFRQFFSAYRIDETTYFQKTFEDFRTIIWDFVDQLAEDVSAEQKDDSDIRTSLDQLKEAVESNSIDVLKAQSRKFIDHYVENQFKKEKRRSGRMKSIRKNLSKVKKQLDEASTAANTDGLTGINNRKAFDQVVSEQARLAAASGDALSLVMLDIDHFKKINDTYGHAVGDFVIKELAKACKKQFSGENDFVARIGGEEFAVVLPGCHVDVAMRKANELLRNVAKEIYLIDEHQIRFTISLGVAQLGYGEDAAAWMKRADLALYNSKNTGRNRASAAPPPAFKVA